MKSQSVTWQIVDIRPGSNLISANNYYKGRRKECSLCLLFSSI